MNNPQQPPTMRRTTRDEKIVRPGVYEVPVEPQQEPDPAARNGWVLREVLFDNGEPISHREPQQEPAEVKQIAEALRQVGLTLVRSGRSFLVMDLGRIECSSPTPPRREWQSISDDEIYDMYCEPRSDAEMVEFARAIEAKLKERNA